jgi:hypothetical protein
LIPLAEEEPAADDNDEDGRRPGGLGDTVHLEGPPDGPSKRAPHLRRDLGGVEDGGDQAIGRLVGTKLEPGSGESIEVAFVGHAIRPSGATGAASASMAARSTRVA